MRGASAGARGATALARGGEVHAAVVAVAWVTHGDGYVTAAVLQLEVVGPVATAGCGLPIRQPVPGGVNAAQLRSGEEATSAAAVLARLGLEGHAVAAELVQSVVGGVAAHANGGRREVPTGVAGVQLRRVRIRRVGKGNGGCHCQEKSWCGCHIGHVWNLLVGPAKAKERCT
jgi:hypothetical protein